jgi:hypothetical protein
MNSVPQHLLSEDRQEYERLLEEALRSASHRPELAAVGQRFNPEQLRTMALNASAFITVAAATEYQHYVKVREELRRPAPSTPSSGEAGAGPMGLATAGEAVRAGEAGRAGLGRRVLARVLGVEYRIGRSRDVSRLRHLPLRLRLAAVVLGVRPRPAVRGIAPAKSTPGTGGVAALAVMAPLLSGAVAVICLVVGYLLKALVETPAAAGAADTVILTGLVLGGITALVISVAVVRLMAIALREALPPQDTDPYYAELSEEVTRAAEAWREALLERGILPFLREALADPGSTATPRPESGPPPPAGRMPRLGYNRPGFSSPDDGPAAGPRPSFSSPDFTSPDFGGPEHQPE